jgi:hypothetical protein
MVKFVTRASATRTVVRCVRILAEASFKSLGRLDAAIRWTRAQMDESKLARWLLCFGQLSGLNGRRQHCNRQQQVAIGLRMGTFICGHSIAFIPGCKRQSQIAGDIIKGRGVLRDGGFPVIRLGYARGRTGPAQSILATPSGTPPLLLSAGRPHRRRQSEKRPASVPAALIAPQWCCNEFVPETGQRSGGWPLSVWAGATNIWPRN